MQDRQTSSQNTYALSKIPQNSTESHKEKLGCEEIITTILSLDKICTARQQLHLRFTSGDTWWNLQKWFAGATQYGSIEKHKAAHDDSGTEIQPSLVCRWIEIGVHFKRGLTILLDASLYLSKVKYENLSFSEV